LSFRAVNKVLEPAFQALRSEVSRRPELLGASVFSLDDILRVLYPFLRRFRAAQAEDPDLVPYIVSADVQRAFDCGEEWQACSPTFLLPTGCVAPIKT
jgi:hypothetical protein